MSSISLCAIASSSTMSSNPIQGGKCKYAGQSVRALPIRILSVGKKRSRGVQLVVDEYVEKIKYYCNVEDVQIRSNPRNARDVKAQVDNEDTAVMNLVNSDDWVVMLDEHGQDIESEQMAELVADAGNKGASRLCFCIGGPYGHGRKLRERANVSVMDYSERTKLPSLDIFDLERQENQLQSDHDAKHKEIQAEINDLEWKLANGCDSRSLLEGLHRSLSESLEKLDSAKKELAARLRAVLAIKRQIDDLPCQSELIQYELRSSELNANIQGKHRQTRKCYATYNALLEIKELMQKETSLLNSIISQFQEAFSSPDGRKKLINSMEGIIKGSQQKLEKVQQGLREEERNLNLTRRSCNIFRKKKLPSD